MASENDDIIAAADKAESEVDFSKMCEGVSYSEGLVHIEQFGSKLSIVTPDEFIKMTPEIFCAVKERAGMNYEQSIMKINEHNGRDSLIKQEELFSIDQILSNYSAGKVIGAQGTGLDKYMTYEVKMSGMLASHNFTTQFMTLSPDTKFMGVVTAVQAAGLPWPVRCPS